MLKIFTFSIVCASFFACPAQVMVTAPLAPLEAELRVEFAHFFSAPVQQRKWEMEDTADVWKQWELVENYSFGLNRGSIPMIADLQSLHPYFRDRVLELIRVCREKGIELAVVETYRTHTKQNEYKSMGRKYTRSGPGHSKHQYGLAIDVVPMIDTVPQWRNIKLWRKIGPIGERLGLRWGGRWRHPFDPGHFEWTGGIGTYNLTQGSFPQVPKPAQYPCLDEDLKELKRHWKSWEAEQSVSARSLRTAAKMSTKFSAAQKQTVRGGED